MSSTPLSLGSHKPRAMYTVSLNHSNNTSTLQKGTYITIIIKQELRKLRFAEILWTVREMQFLASTLPNNSGISFVEEQLSDRPGSLREMQKIARGKMLTDLHIK